MLKLVALCTIGVLTGTLDGLELMGMNFKVMPSFAWDNVEEAVTFKLFTRDSPNRYQKLMISNDDTFLSSSFNRSLPTVIFITGFMSSEKSDSVKLVRKAYMLRGDHNLIFVDWSDLAAGPWYGVASQNVVPVGRHTARLIDHLVNNGVLLDSFHLVGMSLGAHAAGVAGRHIRSGKLRRITGLDPAYPGFRSSSDNILLSHDDAKFVDVIHTDAGRFGFPSPLGHVDFYPNGGTAFQPGCSPFEIFANVSVFKLVLCSHEKAFTYYADSVINEKKYHAVPCNSWRNFKNGLCSSTTEATYMGFAVEPSARGSYYLRTFKKG